MFNTHLLWHRLHTCSFNYFFNIFHNEKRHDTKDYFMLKNEIETLISKGYLKHFVKGNAHIN